MKKRADEKTDIPLNPMNPAVAEAENQPTLAHWTGPHAGELGIVDRGVAGRVVAVRVVAVAAAAAAAAAPGVDFLFEIDLALLDGGPCADAGV